MTADEPTGDVSTGDGHVSDRGRGGDADRGQSADERPGAASRRRRRVTRPAPAGSDPEPADPPLERRSESENDARLRADRPPHWG
ncbi:hypothetical protein [Leucobacter triazinivorans]|uniref:Uncharacterized protein n=1 Tax=Leucobacter triazinivorans TaxID=1784719 RepID=A0A4P6KIU7_9MICO|nr:hypothetical protein [Leucobacter triazinivorans]QBE49514.1 hypothetical protein EVS81_12285 [Leucobacter triazinivorans]